MQATRLGLVASVVLLAGTAGCSLPHALPLVGGTTAGPSPYGVWYEQHWATNAVLLAAADQPEEEVAPAAMPAETIDTTVGAPEVSVESEIGVREAGPVDPVDADAEAAAREAAREAASTATVSSSVEPHAGDGEQFDESSPYQFPASSFTPGTGEEKVPKVYNAPVPDGPIRY